MATREERLRYVIQAIWQGRGATARAKTDIEGLGDSGQRTQVSLKSFNDTLGKVSGVAAGAAGALGVLKSAYDFSKEATALDALESKFDSLARKVNSTAESMTAALRTASQNSVDDATLMSAGFTFLQMGLADTEKSAADLLQKILLLKKPTESAHAAIENFTLMLSNQSVARLDSFGLSSGKVRTRIDELLKSGQALNREQAFMMATFEEMDTAISNQGLSFDDIGTSYDRLETRIKNVKDEFKELLAEGLNPVIDVLAAGVEEPERFDPQLRRPIDELMTQAERINEVSAIWLGFGPLFSGQVDDIRSGVTDLTFEMARSAGSVEEFKAAIDVFYGGNANRAEGIIEMAGGLEAFYESQQRVNRAIGADNTLANYTDSLEVMEGRMYDLITAQERLRRGIGIQDANDQVNAYDEIASKYLLLQRLEDEFAAAAERGAERRAEAQGRVLSAFEAQQSLFEQLGAGQSALESASLLGDVEGVESASAQIEEALAGISAARREMVAEMVENEFGGVFNESVANALVGMGLLDEGMAQTMLQALEVNREFENLGGQLIRTFSADGFLSGAEGELIGSTLAAIESGILGIDEALDGLSSGKLAETVAAAETFSGDLKAALLPEDDLFAALDIDMTGIETARDLSGELAGNLATASEGTEISVDDSALGGAEEKAVGLNEELDRVASSRMIGIDASGLSGAIQMAGELTGMLDGLNGRTITITVASGGGGATNDGNVPGYHAGGIVPLVPGTSPGRDGVLINAAPGELIVPFNQTGSVSEVARFAASQGVPAYHAGGFVGSPPTPTRQTRVQTPPNITINKILMNGLMSNPVVAAERIINEMMHRSYR